MLRKLVAVPMIVLGLMFSLIEAPGVWADYRLDRQSLTETTKFDPPDGGCSPNFGIFITCGFAVVHSQTREVTLFDYIHVKWGVPAQVSAVPLLSSDETILSFSYGLELLPQRLIVIVLGVVLVLIGAAILWRGRGLHGPPASLAPLDKSGSPPHRIG